MNSKETTVDTFWEEGEEEHDFAKVLDKPNESGQYVLEWMETEWLAEFEPTAYIFTFTKKMFTGIFPHVLAELLELVADMKENKVMDERILAIYETLLLSIEYIGNVGKTNKKLSTEEAETLNRLLEETFFVDKTAAPFEGNERYPVAKGTLTQRDNKITIEDMRELNDEKPYSCVLLKSGADARMKFLTMSHYLCASTPKSSTNGLSREEKTEGHTNQGYHDWTLSTVTRLINIYECVLTSLSMKDNKLYAFDEMDTASFIYRTGNRDLKFARVRV